MRTTELNYDIHNIMLASGSSFKEWRIYTEGAEHSILVYSDDKNVEYFTTTKVLNPSHARWAQELAGYNLKIVYSPSKLNGKLERYLSNWSIALRRGLVGNMIFN
jgi:hypothetical protein